jgi:putative FmdB family regulatory protein
MPTYDYLCQSCGHGFEQFQSITAKRLRKCPKCKKLKLNRLIGTGAGIIFKGSGFYETDYRSESYKKGKEAEKPKTDTKKDDKAAATTETKTEKKDTKDTAKKTEPKKKS